MPDHEFLIKPSKIYLGLLSFVCLSSFGIILTLSVSKWLILFFMIVVSLYSAYLLQRFGLQKHHLSVLKLRHQSDGSWLLQTQRDGDLLAELSGHSTVTRVFCVLCFKKINSYRLLSCLVFRDSLTTDQYRQLIVRLKTY